MILIINKQIQSSGSFSLGLWIHRCLCYKQAMWSGVLSASNGMQCSQVETLEQPRLMSHVLLHSCRAASLGISQPACCFELTSQLYCFPYSIQHVAYSHKLKIAFYIWMKKQKSNYKINVKNKSASSELHLYVKCQLWAFCSFWAIVCRKTAISVTHTLGHLAHLMHWWLNND